MSNWKDYFKKKKTESIVNTIDDLYKSAVKMSTPIGIITGPAPASIYSSTHAGNIASGVYVGGSTHTGSTAGMYTINVPAPTHVISISNAGKEIVKLNLDGSVSWANGYEINEAAEAFGKMLSISLELKAGITESVKIKMRDSVFEDLIAIAKEKGSLTAEDLTYLLASSKIVEKLKGGE